MQDLSVCVIGGGSTYTPELIEGFINHAVDLPVRCIRLMDIDAERLEIVGGLAQRMVEAAESELTIELLTDQQEALSDADLVLTQLRVGGSAARIRDERIPAKYGVVGQETTGPGGFAKALRTIPVVLGIAHDIERVAPGAKWINFANPSGLVTEAVLKHSATSVIGLCNVPIGLQRGIADGLGVEPKSVRLDYVGLNHLSWIRGIHVDGVDVMNQVIERVAESDDMTLPFPPDVLRLLRMIPSYYLEYFYHTDRILEKQASSEKTRGEIVAEIESGLLSKYVDPSLVTKPAELEQRGGAYYSTAAIDLMRSWVNDSGDVQIVDTLNGGAIPDLGPDVVVEVPCVIDGQGAHPIACEPLPPVIRGLVQQVKAYEELTVIAAVTGDEKAAVEALLANPLVPSFEIAQLLWADILKENAAELPQFAGESG